MIAPLPSNESQRLDALRDLAILDTPQEQGFDDITALAAQICGTPIALITLIDESRQWFKSKVGLTLDETSRDHAFCAHALIGNSLLLVPDASTDARFADNPFVTGDPGIRFYVGTPLVTAGGKTLGTLCVIDTVPRDLEESQLFALRVLGRQVMNQIQSRRELAELKRTEAVLLGLLEERELSELTQRSLAENLTVAQAVGKVGSWETDGTTWEVAWTVQTHRIFETCSDTFVPSHTRFLEFVHPDDREEVNAALVSSFQHWEPCFLRHRIVMPDGRVKHIEERWQAFPDEENRMRRAIGTCQDISSRWQAQETLRESERRFRELAENISEVFWITDPHHHEMLYVSPSYERVWGRTCESLYQFPDNWQESIHPEDRERVLLANTGVIREQYDEIYRIIREDGEIRWIHDRAYPVQDETGEVYRIVGTAADITDRKHAEEKVREQATLLDKARDAILVRDLDHRVIYWNQSAERLYGWTAAEALGVSAREMLYRDSKDFTAAMSRTLELGEWQGEIQQVNKAGNTLTVEARWTLVRDGEGEPKSVLAINTDITDRQKLEQQFLRAQRMESIGTLAGGIAHDLNNVLAPITMSIKLLGMIVKEPRALEILAVIETSARRGSEMVSQVLTFARGSDGHRSPVLIRSLIEELVRIIRDTFPKDITISTDLAPDLWSAEVDSTQIHQVLLNFCVNARDAMPRGGKLTIRATNKTADPSRVAIQPGINGGQYIHIDVEDTGTGMPKELIESIFDPFFTTKEPGKGTGLGLSTSQAIIKSHGGFIEVYSEPANGSRFSVYLPADGKTEPESTAKDESALPRGKGETVLVVDDENSIREITRQTLEAYGYSVLTAGDGAEAVSIYMENRGRIDVILTDMTMPVMSGPSLMIALKAIDPGIRVIGASGIAESDLVAKSRLAGMMEFLPKPFTTESLLKALRKTLTVGR